MCQRFRIDIYSPLENFAEAILPVLSDNRNVAVHPYQFLELALFLVLWTSLRQKLFWKGRYLILLVGNYFVVLNMDKARGRSLRRESISSERLPLVCKTDCRV